MKVFKVFPGDGTKYVTNHAHDLNAAPVGSVIRVVEMTEEDYNAIPTTPDTMKFFGKDK